jgi:hypothetical protein
MTKIILADIPHSWLGKFPNRNEGNSIHCFKFTLLNETATLDLEASLGIVHNRFPLSITATNWHNERSDLPRSSSGLGRRPLTPVTRVRLPYGVLAALKTLLLQGFFMSRRQLDATCNMGDEHLIWPAFAPLGCPHFAQEQLAELRRQTSVRVVNASDRTVEAVHAPGIPGENEIGTIGPSTGDSMFFERGNRKLTFTVKQGGVSRERSIPEPVLDDPLEIVIVVEPDGSHLPFTLDTRFSYASD